MENTKPTWTTQYGLTLLIEHMTNSHIQNAIQHLNDHATELRQIAISEAQNFGVMLQGDMATFYAEHDLNQLIDESDIEFLYRTTKYRALIEEANKRGIKHAGIKEPD